MKYYIDVFRNFANFKGTLSRKGYWMFVIFYSIFVLIMIILDNLYGTTFKIEGQSLGYGYFYLIFSLINTLPGLSACVRRLHDVGKNGLLILSFLFLSLELFGY